MLKIVTLYDIITKLIIIIWTVHRVKGHATKSFKVIINCSLIKFATLQKLKSNKAFSLIDKHCDKKIKFIDITVA